MNLAVIPLLIVSLVLLSADSDAETAQMIMTGTHQVQHLDGALIVAEATVTIPAGVAVSGPIYLIGGNLTVGGTVTGDVIQLAGTLVVEAGAEIGEELRHIAGTQDVSDQAEIGRRTSLELAGATDRGVVGGLVPGVLLALLLAGVGYRLTRKRTAALDNVAAAVTGHPVATLTVGVLLTLTFVSVFVFMAMTLILIPIAIVGLLAGLMTIGFGAIAWGHLLGSRLPVRSPRVATLLGVVALVIGLQLAGAIPVVGDLLVAAVLLTGLGAVVVTYFGVTRFRPAPLSD